MKADLETNGALIRVARFPHLRTLAWSGDFLYASRGYQLLRAKMEEPSDNTTWQPVASYRPSLKRRLSVINRLSMRLFRDGFHALAVLPSGGLVAAVPGAIVTARPSENNFRSTHAIVRGTRPLHITATPNGNIYWGEYFDNRDRDEVHIFASTDAGETWSVAYTFPKGAIRHVHNIVHDPWQNCLWVLTGDYGDECRILRASYDFSQIEFILHGQQQTRAVAAIPTQDALYFSSDTPLESNFIYRLDRQGLLSQCAAISSSSIYGCGVKGRIFFSTMVEPSKVNRNRQVHVYGCDPKKESWRSLLEWKKDIWPMGLFQYGNAFFPDGTNATSLLALTTIAVKADDIVMFVYSIND